MYLRVAKDMLFGDRILLSPMALFPHAGRRRLWEGQSADDRLGVDAGQGTGEKETGAVFTIKATGTPSA